MNKKISFSIIAHVDHGKSTLSDRILEMCGAKDPGLKEAQILDKMNLEKEMGITIKAQSVRLNYKGNILTLIDTPGHVDFSYEVQRSLSACETCLLIVDSTQGVQAQTLAHLHKALEAGHTIIPVLNKIDLPTSNVDMCIQELKEMGISIDNIQYVSAKSGAGVEGLLDTIIRVGRCAEIDNDGPIQARIIDSDYVTYSGIIFLIRIFTGTLKVGDTVQTYYSKNKFLVKKLTFLTPEPVSVERIESGDIAMLITATKDANTMPGDVLWDGKTDLIPALQTNIIVKPIVFYTMYLQDTDMADRASTILKKYQLNDSAFTFAVENNILYGVCFNCGFLGILHCAVVQERLSRDYGLRVCTTAPSVEYHVYMNNGDCLSVTNHKQLPSMSLVSRIEEPYTSCKIFISKNTNVGQVLDLCSYKRATNIQTHIHSNKVIITCEMPLIEVITNFNDKLKSLTSGYASLEYDLIGYDVTNLTKLIVVINNIALDNNGMLIHESRARRMAGLLAQNLKEVISRSQVATKIQIIASTSEDNKSKNVLASAEISAYRKDVIAKCYGGDISRKKKLLEKQKAGKARNSDIDTSSSHVTNIQWSKAMTKSQNAVDE